MPDGPNIVPGPIHVNWCDTPDVDETLTPDPDETPAHFRKRAIEWFTNLYDSHPPKPCS